MKKEQASFLIAILIGIVSIIILFNFRFSVDLKLENKVKSIFYLGWQDKENIVSINLATDNIYTAFSSSYDEETTYKYTNFEFIEDDIEWMFSVSQYWSDFEIIKQNLKDYRYTEIVMYEKMDSANPFSIKYQLLKNEEQYNEIINAETGDKIKVNNHEIFYYVKHSKLDNSNVYYINSILPVKENTYLFIQIYYENLNKLNLKRVDELLTSIYESVEIIPEEINNEVIEEEKTDNKTEQNVSSEKTMYCTSTETSNEYEGTYTHIMTFENNICTKYVMKMVQKYFDYNTYQKYKGSYVDTTYDDASMTITTYIGDGYAGLNGNEQLYHSKTLEQAKETAEQYGSKCEVK